MSILLRSFKTVKLSRGLTSHAILNQNQKTLYYKLQLRNNLSLLQRNLSKVTKERNSSIEIDNRIASIDDIIKSGRPLRFSYVQKIIHLLYASDNADSVQILLLLRCCGNIVQDSSPERKTDAAQHLWNYIDMHNVPVSVLHYNALLKVYLDNDSEFCPKTILSEMRNKKLGPSQITYERIIDYYCKRGNITEAMELLKVMNSEGFRTSENVYNSLIKGYSESGDMKRAKKVLYDMERDKITPSPNTYTALICAYAKKNDIQQVVELMCNCERKQLTLSHSNILSIIYELALHNNKEYIEMMFFSLQKFSYPVEELGFVIKLLKVGKVELAQKILFQIIPAVKNKVWLKTYINLFIEALVQTDTSFENIYTVCTQLEASNALENVMIQALLSTLVHKNEELAMKFLDRFIERGIPVKPHYFWPLLIARAHKHDLSGIMNILTRMKFSYNTIPDISTIKEYVIPYVTGTIPHLRPLLLQSYIPETIVDNGIVHLLLKNNEMKEAYEYMERHQTIYWATELNEVLIRNLYKSLDVESYVSICHNLYRKEINDSRDHNTITDIASVALVSMDEHLLSFLQNAAKNRIVMLSVLRCLNKVGISLSKNTVNEIKEYMGDYLTYDITNLLTQLLVKDDESNTLTVTDCSQESVYKDPDSLYDSILTGWERNMPTEKLELELISYIERRKIQPNVNPKLYLFAINYYINNGDEESVSLYLKKLRDYYDDLSRFKHAVLKYVGLLMYYRKFNDARKMLHISPEHITSNVLQRSSIMLLRTIARRCDLNEFDIMYRVLLSNNYMTETSESYSVMLEFFIQRGNLQKAVEYFCSNPRDVPILKSAQSKLMKELIETKNKMLLEEVTEHCNQIQGPEETLVLLLFTYIECNKLAEAEILLQNPLISKTSHKIEDRIHRYTSANDKQNLLRIFAISPALPDVMKNFVCMTVLRNFVRTNDWEGGLYLWKTMVKNNTPVPGYFLAMLSELLKSNGQEVPFTYTHNVEGVDCNNVDTDLGKDVNEAVVPSVLQ